MKMYNNMLNLSLVNMSFVNMHLIDYPTPMNMNYFWGFGFLAAMCLLVQMISGILLSMHYSCHINLAFNSMEHMMRDVNNGWILSYMHSNGASIFFMIMYIHMGRGLYFKSYSNMNLWLTGIMMFGLMMATAFMGYVLVWGQMSFWGATVMTNLASAMPIVGNNMARWLWGGFSMDNATLNRFFSLHFLLPFMMAGLAIIHILVLHINGSTNPLGMMSKSDKISLYPYFVLKDIFGLFLYLMSLFMMYTFFEPNLLGHPDNYMSANSLVTPTHMVPEWYFLMFYAILSSIPDKQGGVLFMVLSMIILAMIPFLSNMKLRSPKFDIIFQMFFWFFMVNSLLLGWLGCQIVEQPYIQLGQISTIFYFSYFLMMIPFMIKLEHLLLNM